MNSGTYLSMIHTEISIGMSLGMLPAISIDSSSDGVVMYPMVQRNSLNTDQYL